jgi:hypothetical protein
MAVALALSLTGGLPWRIASWSWARTRLTEGRQSDGLVGLAAAGAVACSIVLPLLELARIATEGTPVLAVRSRRLWPPRAICRCT